MLLLSLDAAHDAMLRLLLLFRLMPR